MIEVLHYRFDARFQQQHRAHRLPGSNDFHQERNAASSYMTSIKSLSVLPPRINTTRHTGFNNTGHALHEF